MKQLLDAVFELIGPVAPHVLEPGPVMAERRIGHRGFEQRVVDAVEFEREEQKMRRGRGQPLLHVAVKFGARRIDRVAGMNEPGIGAEPAHQIVDRLVAPHRLGELSAGRGRSRQPGELALVCILERDALDIGAIEIAFDRRIVEAGIKVGEIPLRQGAERGFGLLRGGAWRALGGCFFQGFRGAGHAFDNPCGGFWRGTDVAPRSPHRKIINGCTGVRILTSIHILFRSGIPRFPVYRTVMLS